ncbi:DUF2523 family protein [Luteimonas sp. R10]|uniref:DUF2523 family protein n=1 Tax=Luteimonas sp. R10 TaxID=3108176 RepID=UPI00308D5DFC|nr:DUF2523 family protein [Luteimonas sp. R10]
MPAIIGALVAALINALRQYLPGIVGRVLLALGIGFFTHTVAMPALLGIIQSKLFGLPGVLVAYFGALGLDVVCTIVISAAAAKATQRLLLRRIGSST